MTTPDHHAVTLTGTQMSEIDDLAKWLENVKASDFRDEAQSAEEEAWKHLFDGVQIMFREGYTSATINVMLGEVLETFETDEDDLDPDEWALEQD